MLDCIDIARLYENVLIADKMDYKISDGAIKFGIECMAHVYKIGLLSIKRSKIADYTDPAHRCAYLHKYAALHTAMVRDMMGEAVRANFGFFREVLFSGQRFHLCSLGGGPGTDVIGVLAALHSTFGYFEAAATVVDYMFEWSYTFSSILKELRTGRYGAFGNNVSYYLDWRYVQANLLKTLQPDVLEALSTASLVTMIKFTSATACQQTRYMIKNIFTAMKPGALLLFIDNDGGGFYDLIKEAMVEYNFISIFGPFRRENYTNEYFSKKRFGSVSCFSTTVTVHILQKPLIFNPYCDIGLLDSYSDMYMPDNRRVLLGNSNVVPPLLGCSPPTPFLYLGQSPDENCNSLVPVRSPQRSRSSTQSFHHTPTRDFAQDENICQEPYFVTSPEELPQSAGSHHSHEVDLLSRLATPSTSNIINSPYGQRTVIYTPDSQPRRGKRPMQSCFPLRNFRRQLAKKVHNVKARARSVFKIKNKKKNHPIFNL